MNISDHNTARALAQSPAGLLIEAFRAAAEHVGYVRGLGKASPTVHAMLDRIETACSRGIPEPEMIKRLVADLREAVLTDAPSPPRAVVEMEWDRMQDAGE